MKKELKSGLCLAIFQQRVVVFLPCATLLLGGSCAVGLGERNEEITFGRHTQNKLMKDRVLTYAGVIEVTTLVPTCP